MRQHVAIAVPSAVAALAVAALAAMALLTRPSPDVPLLCGVPGVLCCSRRWLRCGADCRRRLGLAYGAPGAAPAGEMPVTAVDRAGFSLLNLIHPTSARNKMRPCTRHNYRMPRWKAECFLSAKSLQRPPLPIIRTDGADGQSGWRQRLSLRRCRPAPPRP